jgi:hypothetical protein
VLTENSLLATRIGREEFDDDILQAPTDSFIVNDSVTLLGVRYSTSGAEFESETNEPMTESEFFDILQEGMLISVKDRELADGFADKIEFEGDIKYESGVEDGEESTDIEDSEDSNETPETEDPEDPNEPEEPEEPEEP